MQKLSLAQSASYRWWAFAAIGIGTFTSVADHGSVLVALPSIAEHFRTDLPTSQWVVIGYALTISALLMPMGRLSDIVGRKRVYVAGFAIFVLGGALAGSSTNMLVLIMSRVLQGAGAAMTQGTGMAMILSTFPSEERGKALGFQLSVVGVGGVFGPALGGLLVGTLDWRWVFYGGISLGVVATLAAMVVLDGSRPSRQDNEESSFDWAGAAFSTGALVAFLLGMTSGPSLGWISPFVVAAMLTSVGLLVAFVWWELRCPAPMMDLRLFRRKLFSLGVSASFISFLGNSSVRFLMPFYLQAVLGYTPVQVGLIIIPSAVAMIVMGPLSGRLSDRYGWRIFNVGGLMLSIAGLFLLATLRENSPLWIAMAGMILQTSGTGVFNPPNNSSILSAVEQSRYGVVSGFLNLVRNSANVTSTALATAIVTASMVSMGYAPSLADISDVGGEGIYRAFTAGLRTAFLAMGSLLLLGVVASLFKPGPLKELQSPQADEAMARRETP